MSNTVEKAGKQQDNTKNYVNGVFTKKQKQKIAPMKDSPLIAYLMMSSDLTKPDGENEEVGLAITCGADKKQNLIKVSVIKEISAKEQEKIVMNHDS
ncbi:hypothetical protein RDI58_017801 [Solanum bulbocastanum]|uniref:Uncharacterized protein n=1 Tax=Solanum bulbocastanum TaxID=147425 RepID=A0AAN8YAB5_SOLBU